MATPWNNQVLTEAQKKASAELWAQSKKSGRIGQQPWAVIAPDGKILGKDMTAVCLAGLWRINMTQKQVEEGAVLFQYVITKATDYQTGSEKLTVSDENIMRWLRWVVHSTTCKPWILEHTKAERLEMGVPITLSCPANIPLLVSTYVRFCWDRHNNKRSPYVFYFKDNFKLTWEQAFFLGSCVAYIPPDGNEGFAIKSYSDGHSPFGDEITLEWVLRWWTVGAPPEWFDGISKFKPMGRRNPGIEDFYGRSEQDDPERFNTWVVEAVGTPESWGADKPAHRWMSPQYPMKAFNDIINLLIKKIKEELDA